MVPAAGRASPLETAVRSINIVVTGVHLKTPFAGGQAMKSLPLPFLALLTAIFPTAARAQDKALVPSITVVGSGKVSARPDMAQVQVGVVSEAPTAAKAVKDNNEAMAKLFTVL